MALEMLKLYGKAAFAAATGGAGALSIAISSAGLASEFLLTEDAPDQELAAMAGSIQVDKAAPDWATKGAHIKVDGIELKVLPGQEGKIVLKSAFSSQPEDKVRAAIRKAESALADPAFVKKLEKATEGMVKHLGQGSPMERAKSGELRFLLKILRKGE